MRAAREAGVIPIGVATGIFSPDELESAGAYQVVPNLKDTDTIFQILTRMNRNENGQINHESTKRRKHEKKR
jgi:hypothetical protein